MPSFPVSKVSIRRWRLSQFPPSPLYILQESATYGGKAGRSSNLYNPKKKKKVKLHTLLQRKQRQQQQQKKMDDVRGNFPPLRILWRTNFFFYCTSVHFRWIIWRQYNIQKRSHANILQDTGLQLISNALPHENDTAHVYFTKEFTLCKN